MNENAILWVLLSTFQYFKDNVKTTFPLIIPAQQLSPNMSANRYELLFIGPDVTFLTKNEYRIDILYNVAIITNKDPEDILAHYKMISKAYSFFSKCIPVNKYGDEHIPENDKSQFTTLQLESKVKLTDIMLFDPVSQQQRSTLEAQYSATIES